MQSRSSSPSRIRNHVEGTYHVPTYNHPVVHDLQTPPFIDTQNHQGMGKPHNSLDILLASDCLYLRGTGVDVETCTLRGSVVLNLVEATSVKEITMQFKGKSRIPQVQSDRFVFHCASYTRTLILPSPSLLTSGVGYQTNTIYSHDWSFLEGERKRSPTLKAGRHVFPFQLQLDGSLPSSLSTHGGLGSISYKLRATAVRPVFSSNLHAATSVRIIRSFATEALEYQQTLDIENTWPEKMMYSFMVPHKAWAAGDTIKIVAKFSPLMKGVHISSITTTVQEHMKIFTKAGQPHTLTRVIATARHEIRNGQAETTQLNDSAYNVTIPHRPTTSRSAPSSPALLEGVHISLPEVAFPMDPCRGSPQQVSSSIPNEGGESSMLGISVGDSEQHASATASSSENLHIGEEEIVATLPIFLPPSSAPSHSLRPIVVTHRIRWSVLMANPDGHMSELRCSLPIHILDCVLLEDARLATRATHRLLFGHNDAQSDSLEELELPSYPAHVLDRIANAHLPPSPLHMPNPLLTHPDADSSGLSSAIPDPEPTSPELPLLHVGGARDGPPGELSGTAAFDCHQVNSELHRLSHALHRGINISTPPDSTQTSRHASRAPSRAASPEPGSTGTGRERYHHHSHHHSIFSLKSLSKVASSLGQGKNQHSSTADNAATISHSNAGSRRPSTDIPRRPEAGSSGPASPMLVPRGRSEDELHAMTISEVPDYDIASRGFLGGGVTPLSSVRGLPSYEEAERSLSDGDLARFVAART